MSIKLTLPRQQGFTLLEIVLVLFLLALLASSTLFLTQGVEDQAKYDATKQRLNMIRTAIIGDTSRTINGHPEISGFAADMGRLPECLRELLSPVDCNDVDLLLWDQDVDSQVWSGWRGPYLIGDSEFTGEMHFRDGYGNSGDTSGVVSEDWRNSGWTFFDDNLSIISAGFDVNVDTDDVPIPLGTQQLISPFDYQITLGTDWQNVKVQFYSESSNGTFIAANSLRVKFNTPVEGDVLNYSDSDLDTPDKRDGSIYLSNTFPENDVFVPLLDGSIEVKDTESLSFLPTATLLAASVPPLTNPIITPITITITITTATVISYTDEDGNNGVFSTNNKCSPNCTLTISGSNYEATNGGVTSSIGDPVDTLEFSAAGTVTISPHYVAPIIAKNLAKPIITVTSGSSLLANTLTLPLGASITLADNDAKLIDDNVILSGTTIIVSAPFTRTGNVITTDFSGDTFIIPSNTPPAVGNTLTIPAASTFIAGEKSFTIVCELGVEQGELFDGNCDNGGVNNISSPTSMSLVPRTSLPVNNAAIEWIIQ